MTVIREITSADSRNRVVIYQRDDNLFTYAQEQNEFDFPSIQWKLTTSSNSIFDSEEAAIFEASSRVEWLKKETSWAARNNPIVRVEPRQNGVVDCPFCKVTFFLKDKNRWASSRHLTCGQKIELIIE